MGKGVATYVEVYTDELRSLLLKPTLYYLVFTLKRSVENMLDIFYSVATLYFLPMRNMVSESAFRSYISFAHTCRRIISIAS